jgi:hypothetical protein
VLRIENPGTESEPKQSFGTSPATDKNLLLMMHPKKNPSTKKSEVPLFKVSSNREIRSRKQRHTH